MTLLESVLNQTHMRAPKGIVYGPPGVGKAQPLDAKVLTPTGFVEMKNIQVGDPVIGADGNPHRVLGVYPQGEKNIFKVIFRDGSATECCDDHLWFTQTLTEREQGIAGAVRSLQAIRATLQYGTRFNHAVPRVQQINFKVSTEPLPLHPWLLGMYLGDGHANTSVVITNPEPDVQEKIVSLLADGDTAVPFDSINLRIVRKSEHTQPSAFMAALRKLNLDRLNAEQKFVPRCYLFASIEDRLQLLRGLFDSDGFVTKPGAIEFCTVSEQLAENVCFLIRSLGGSAKLSRKKTTFTYCGEKREGQLAYRIYGSFTNGVIPVSSKKHGDKWQPPQWVIRHTIREIQPAGRKICQCIKIDAIDSLYVTDDFIVTHNTTFGAATHKPIIIDCENGAAHMQCDRTPYLADWDTIQPWLEALAHDEHTYGTVVIDSIDWLLRRMEERVAGVNGDPRNMDKTMNRSHGGYGNGKQVLRNYVYQYLLPTLDAMVNKGISVVLLAHASRRTITTIDGISMEKSAPEIHPDLMNTMVEWSDFVGAARMDGDLRELVLNETAQLLAKNRYGISGVLPLDWNCFINAMSNHKPQVTGETING
ncbi:MAG TPA: AAA family ATPase [Anaerohalosphaeraceae bacterium]|nr:AAA family ATPase [Anaerohalosphaeraceae bacterium]